MNDCAPGLALIERLKATRKWPIKMTAPSQGIYIDFSCKLDCVQVEKRVRSTSDWSN